MEEKAPYSGVWFKEHTASCKTDTIPLEYSAQMGVITESLVNHSTICSDHRLPDVGICGKTSSLLGHKPITILTAVKWIPNQKHCPAEHHNDNKDSVSLWIAVLASQIPIQNVSIPMGMFIWLDMYMYFYK